MLRMSRFAQRNGSKSAEKNTKYDFLNYLMHSETVQLYLQKYAEKSKLFVGINRGSFCIVIGNLY